MKYTIQLILIVVLLACSIPKDIYLTKKELDSSVVYSWDEKIKGNIKYYIVTPEQLVKVRSGIFYVGSIEKYHLFHSVPKRPMGNDEAFNFAVLKKHCRINKTYPPDSNEARIQNAPWIQFENGKIVVK